MNFLGSLDQEGNRKIAVLAIGGPANTGKSSLANKFVGSEEAFKVRDEMPGSKGTEGIFLWDSLIPMSGECDALVLDCQGINDESAYPEIDIKLMALSMLLSSSFLFNT